MEGGKIQPVQLKIKPIVSIRRKADMYACPLYRTAQRKGEINASGHNTNYVQDFDIKTDLDPNIWVRRGVALLCEVNEE